MTTEILPTPAKPVVPPYPALGSANFNAEAYEVGSKMPGVIQGVHDMATAVEHNARFVEAKAQAVEASRQEVQSQVSTSSSAASRAEVARDRAVQAEQAIDQALADGPVLSVDGQNGVVQLNLNARMQAAALSF